MRTAQMYEEEERTAASNDAEFSLGLGSLIGIFFGLALVCGVFFGFGYTLGHRSQPAPVPSEPASEPSAQTPALVAPKPSAQVLQQQPEATQQQVIVPETLTAQGTPTLATATATTTARETASAVAAPSLKPQPVAVATSKAPQPATVASAPEPAGTVPTETIMVQIAAVRSRPDAEALAAALRKNGFTPSIRTESQDKLLHVQIGPFASRDEAKAMRQKLSSSGYNAFIK